jgi:hypothetical protein
MQEIVMAQVNATTLSHHCTAGQSALHRYVANVLAGLQALMRELFDPYRPELHYMRGPGPKWREKHPA